MFNFFIKSIRSKTEGGKFKIKALNIEKIICPSCKQVRNLCKELGVKCAKK